MCRPLRMLLLVAATSCLVAAAQGRRPPQIVRALSRQAESGVISALRSQVGQLSSPMPGGVLCPSCLIVGPNAHSQLFQGSVERSQLQAGIRSHGLPQEVADRLSALAFARSVSFHTFSFSVSTLVGRGHYETFIGAGRRIDDATVEFGVIRSVASAQLVAKFTPVPMRSCKRRFFIKRCRSWTEQVPRGLTADELRLVEAGLRHYAMSAAASRLTGASFLRSRRSIDEELAEEVPATTVEPADAAQNASLIELVRTGFDRLAVSATTQNLRRIPVSRLNAFAAVFVRSLHLPSSLVGPVRDAVTSAVATEGAAKRLSVLFNSEDDPTAIRFIQLALVRRSGRFDVASATVRLEARFADRLQLLVSQDDNDGGEDDIRVRRLPAQVGQEEMQQVLRLLQSAASGRLSGKSPLLTA